MAHPASNSPKAKSPCHLDIDYIILTMCCRPVSGDGVNIIGKFTAMIINILHFHLQLQCKNELFYIYFTSFHSLPEI